eukprot:359041-Chlamydomonas_euryale.AAC.1
MNGISYTKEGKSGVIACCAAPATVHKVLGVCTDRSNTYVPTFMGVGPTSIFMCKVSQQLEDVRLDLLRRGGGGVAADDLPVLGHEEFRKVPLDVVVEQAALLAFQEFKHRVGVRAIHIDLQKWGR